MTPTECILPLFRHRRLRLLRECFSPPKGTESTKDRQRPSILIPITLAREVATNFLLINKAGTHKPFLIRRSSNVGIEEDRSANLQPGKKYILSSPLNQNYLEPDTKQGLSLSPGLLQEFHDFEMASVGRNAKGCSASGIFGVHVGPSVEQNLHDVAVTACRRKQ
jgi:hypothetical protein